jgi:hypothetical protein
LKKKRDLRSGLEWKIFRLMRAKPGLGGPAALRSDFSPGTANTFKPQNN